MIYKEALSMAVRIAELELKLKEYEYDNNWLMGSVRLIVGAPTDHIEGLPKDVTKEEALQQTIRILCKYISDLEKRVNE